LLKSKLKLTNRSLEKNKDAIQEVEIPNSWANG